MGDRAAGGGLDRGLDHAFDGDTPGIGQNGPAIVAGDGPGTSSTFENADTRARDRLAAVRAGFKRLKAAPRTAGRPKNRGTAASRPRRLSRSPALAGGACTLATHAAAMKRKKGPRLACIHQPRPVAGGTRRLDIRQPPSGARTHWPGLQFLVRFCFRDRRRARPRGRRL